MDEGFFIRRDAQIVGAELREGHGMAAAANLREDCEHMNPREFSSLVRQAIKNEGPCSLAKIELCYDGNVMVRSQDGRHIPAGRLPQCEMADLLPPPPRPPVVIIERPREYPRPCPEPPIIIREQPRERVIIRENAPLSNTTVDTIGGAIIGGVIGQGRGKNGALKGALIGGAAGAIIGTAQDNAERR